MEQLYKNLIALTEKTDAKFFFSDHVGMPHAGSRIFRIFNYHIANYTDWLLPDALACRGIMFEITAAGKPVKLVSKTPLKFFNLNENPMTMDLELDKVDQIFDKADGSLISTYPDGEFLRLKSKGSLASPQALASMEYLKMHGTLGAFLHDCAFADMTVNLEWTAPNNRIVLGYAEPKLIILNIINNDTGEYIDFDELPIEVYNNVKDYMIDEYDAPTILEDRDWVSKIKAQAGIEGVIFRIGEKYVKLKTDWYVQLHSNKDSISNPKRLVLTVLDNNHDDLRALFHDDKETLTRINDFETAVNAKIMEYTKVIFEAHLAHKGKERKFYAIDGRNDLVSEQNLFGVYMQLFQGIGNISITERVIDMLKRNPESIIPEKYKC